MSKKCQISGKAKQRGCNISKAHNKTLRTWEPNLKWKRLFDTETGAFVRVKVSTRLLRTIDRKGLSATLRDHGLTIDDVK